MKPILLVGGPGTGKTFSLVERIVSEKPKKFALLTFTRQAANEAKQRLRSYYSEKELRYVRTIHSLCFELLGINTNQVFTYYHYCKFGEVYGYDLHGKSLALEDGTKWGLTEDDQRFRRMMLNPLVHSDMQRNYRKYKVEYSLYDFNDMITMVISNYKIIPRLNMLCVDEFQDLSPIQLKFISYIKYDKAIFAADDDQMIYQWAGVDRKQFKETSEQCEIIVLDKIYRMGRQIINISQRPIRKMNGWRIPKMINRYDDDMPSKVKLVIDLDELYSAFHFDDWLILCRNNYQMREAADYLKFNNLKFALVGEYPDVCIKMCTIHASKGLEAENVVIFSDVSPATYEHITDDAEHRVWYVGLTRAKRNLYIVEPRTTTYYELL